MKTRKAGTLLEPLESRRLFAWSAYAQLVDQDVAAEKYANLTGQGVTVAVIDTGIDYSLSSLGGGFGSKYKVIAGYDFYAEDSDPMDESGHGTGVASVIAAEPYTTGGVTYRGVALDAKLVALRVGTEDSIANSDIERALQWVISNYAKYSISVVNLSLGSGNYVDAQTNSQMSDEFATLRELGIFVVAASGNSNDQNSGPISQDGVAYPSADPNVFAVAAVDSTDVISTWSQRGDELDLLAPGVDIVMPRVGSGYQTESGTSFASPYVAGTAALLKQADSSLKAGDIGSMLMSGGAFNRDGDKESGDTTGLSFSRLDIDNSIALVAQRKGKYDALHLTKTFDTVLDSQGVLHAAFYDTAKGDLLYATRSTSGLWSEAKVIDSAGDVGAQLSIAIDATGKIGIGYFDVTNTALKYARFSGTGWSNVTIDSEKHVGTSPSLGFSIDGDAFLAYNRRTGGYLRLATMERDTGKWVRKTVDGLDGASVGASLSLDVGEAAIRSGLFTRYDTTVAIAYSDVTNGNLKYARLDVDDSAATWFVAVVDDTNGVGNIDLNLHAGPTSSGLQAQIAYQATAARDVRYAYRNTDWFVETVATAGDLGAVVQLSFDSANSPMVTFFNNTKRAIYTSTRSSSGNWNMQWDATGSGVLSVSLNERSGQAILSYLNRARSDVFSNDLL